jgi:hypothetical protein
MDMAMKEKLLLSWILLVMACSFFFSHFWSYTIYVVQKAVALGILPALLLAKFLAGIVGIHVLA